jgi:hemoglobin
MLVLAADDAGLPSDPTLRAALRAYMKWAVGEVVLSRPNDSTIPPHLPVRHWSWDGLQAACLRRGTNVNPPLSLRRSRG